LNYLPNNTQPNIQYAVHGNTQYSHIPTDNHAKAIKQIVWYLLGTALKSLVLHPNLKIALDMYEGADFADMGCCDAKTQDPVCVKSCNGYILLLAGCPLLWASKLQMEMATSTWEANSLCSVQEWLILVRLILQAIANALNMTNVPKEANLRIIMDVSC
jgi:hypothetical protein